MQPYFMVWTCYHKTKNADSGYSQLNGNKYYPVKPQRLLNHRDLWAAISHIESLLENQITSLLLKYGKIMKSSDL
jgi:hypothetical protein